MATVGLQRMQEGWQLQQGADMSGAAAVGGKPMQKATATAAGPQGDGLYNNQPMPGEKRTLATAADRQQEPQACITKKPKFQANVLSFSDDLAQSLSTAPGANAADEKPGGSGVMDILNHDPGIQALHSLLQKLTRKDVIKEQPEPEPEPEPQQRKGWRQQQAGAGQLLNDLQQQEQREQTHGADADQHAEKKRQGQGLDEQQPCLHGQDRQSYRKHSMHTSHSRRHSPTQEGTERQHLVQSKMQTQQDRRGMSAEVSVRPSGAVAAVKQELRDRQDRRDKRRLSEEQEIQQHKYHSKEEDQEHYTRKGPTQRKEQQQGKDRGEQQLMQLAEKQPAWQKEGPVKEQLQRGLTGTSMDLDTVAYNTEAVAGADGYLLTSTEGATDDVAGSTAAGDDVNPAKGDTAATDGSNHTASEVGSVALVGDDVEARGSPQGGELACSHGDSGAPKRRCRSIDRSVGHVSDRAQEQNTVKQDRPAARYNFAVTLDMQTSGTHARSRVVHTPSAGIRYAPHSTALLQPRVVGSSHPALSAPSSFYQHRSLPYDEDKRTVTRRSSDRVEVSVAVRDPSKHYLHAVISKIIPDPCHTHDPMYNEGVRRMNEYLDGNGVREVMNLHFELRAPTTIAFGTLDLSTIRNKQAWVITTCRKIHSRVTQDLQFSRQYTLGCYRIHALMTSRVAQQLIQQIPVRKRMFLIQTLGGYNYYHMADNPTLIFRLLVHHFTPFDLVNNMLRIQQIPGPTPKGNINVQIRPQNMYGPPSQGSSANQGARHWEPRSGPAAASSFHAADNRDNRGSGGTASNPRFSGSERGYTGPGRDFSGRTPEDRPDRGWVRARDQDRDDRELGRSSGPPAFRDMPRGTLAPRGPPEPFHMPPRPGHAIQSALPPGFNRGPPALERPHFNPPGAHRSLSSLSSDHRLPSDARLPAPVHRSPVKAVIRDRPGPDTGPGSRGPLLGDAGSQRYSDRAPAPQQRALSPPRSEPIATPPLPSCDESPSSKPAKPSQSQDTAPQAASETPPQAPSQTPTAAETMPATTAAATAAPATASTAATATPATQATQVVAPAAAAAAEVVPAAAAAPALAAATAAGSAQAGVLELLLQAAALQQQQQQQQAQASQAADVLSVLTAALGGGAAPVATQAPLLQQLQLLQALTGAPASVLAKPAAVDTSAVSLLVLQQQAQLQQAQLQQQQQQAQLQQQQALIQALQAAVQQQQQQPAAPAPALPAPAPAVTAPAPTIPAPVSAAPAPAPAVTVVSAAAAAAQTAAQPSALAQPVVTPSTSDMDCAPPPPPPPPAFEPEPELTLPAHVPVPVPASYAVPVPVPVNKAVPVPVVARNAAPVPTNKPMHIPGIPLPISQGGPSPLPPPPPRPPPGSPPRHPHPHSRPAPVAAAPAAAAPKHSLRRLGLRAAGGCSSPAPWRSGLPPGAIQAVPQDARAIGTYALAVADGVAATCQLGVDSAPWAQTLSETVVQVADAAVYHAISVGGVVNSPRQILAAAMDRVPGSGAASCCVVYIAGNELFIGRVGSCAAVVLRGNGPAGEMRAVNSWRPYQESGDRTQHLASQELAPLVGAHPPAAAHEERVPLQPGDILVLGTHGLFDMVWFHGPPSSNLLRELYTLFKSQQVEPQLVAKQLTSLATSMAVSGALSGSPLLQQLNKEGRVPVPMQDVGDNTAVIAHIM